MWTNNIIIQKHNLKNVYSQNNAYDESVNKQVFFFFVFYPLLYYRVKPQAE